MFMEIALLKRCPFSGGSSIFHLSVEDSGDMGEMAVHFRPTTLVFEPNPEGVRATGILAAKEVTRIKTLTSPPGEQTFLRIYPQSIQNA